MAKNRLGVYWKFRKEIKSGQKSPAVATKIAMAKLDKKNGAKRNSPANKAVKKSIAARLKATTKGSYTKKGK